MTDEQTRDLEARLARSLHAAAPVPPPGLGERLLSTTAVVGQRRRWTVLTITPVLGSAAAVVLAAVVGLQVANVLRDGRGIGGPEPTGAAAPTRSFEPTQSASAVPSADESTSQSASPVPSAAESTSPSPSAAGEGNACTNEELRFSVRYPSSWWVNEHVEPTFEGGDPIHACTFFGEQPVELEPNAHIPVGVAIGFDVEPVILPPSDTATTLSARETTVGDRPATVREDEEGPGSSWFAPGTRMYSYYVELPSGEYLVAWTAGQGPTYESHTEVLDRMMESLRFLDD